MSIELKIKALSLAAEARIIRRLELERKKRYAKALNKVKEKSPNSVTEYIDYHIELLNKIHNHRVVDVRKAARSTHLARAFLKGIAYRRVEESCYDLPNYETIAKMVRNYGGDKYNNVTWHTIRSWANVLIGDEKYHAI